MRRPDGCRAGSSRKGTPLISATRSGASTGAASFPPPVLPAEDASVGLILSTLDDAKAENVVSIDLVGKTTIADAMVIASGRSNRHVAAIAEQLLEAFGKAGRKGLRVEGLPTADWVLIDAGDSIVHIFRPEVRDFYNLEKMWSSARPSERSVA